MAAVTKSQQRDAGVEALLARINSNKEASALSSDDDEVGRGASTSCHVAGHDASGTRCMANTS